MVINISNDSIADFYKGKSVFITGGTGFLGKVFIEKLLYSCPDLEKIYMLIREKKGFTVNQRLNEFLEDSLFDRLRNKRPQDLEKIVPIPGDVDSIRLGITQEDENTLIEKVSIIIHAAATVKFNEPLKVAWKINVEGTKMVLDLSRRIKQMEVFVHISTAYSNTNRDVIEEVLYPPPADLDEVHQLVKNNISEEETVKLIGERPNAYTFTKALTEHLIAKNQEFTPSVIIRPSVVAATKNDPIKGWLQNWFGATALAVFTTKGLNRVIYGRSSNSVDIIPVDYVANLVIASAAKDSRSKELKIYNSCTSGCNPISLSKFLSIMVKENEKFKSNWMPLPNWYTFTESLWVVATITFLFQYIPAYLMDVFRRITGKQAMFVKLYSRVLRTRQLLDYFTIHSWVIKADRTRELFASLSPSDKEIFPCDPTTIDWRDYLRDYVGGIRKYLEKIN